MQVKRILETDVLAKVTTIYPETPMIHGRVDLEKIHRAMDAANVFGSLQMRILADLSPIELMYLIETNHKLTYSTAGWVVPLHFVEIAFGAPDLMIAAAYEGANLDNIYTDSGILTMIGNSISQDAQRRFLDNAYINTLSFGQNPAFDGWNMLGIEFDATHDTIAPINPVTKYQIAAQNRFEQKLREYVGAFRGDAEYDVKFNATYTKHVNIHEFFNLVAQGRVNVTNINYGIQQLIKDGYIPQDLYSKSTTNNVLGNPQEHISGDIDAIEKLMADDKIWFLVVLTHSVSYHIDDGGGSVMVNRDECNFDRYLRSVMDDNIRELLPEYGWSDDEVEAEAVEIKVPTPLPAGAIKVTETAPDPEEILEADPVIEEEEEDLLPEDPILSQPVEDPPHHHVDEVEDDDDEEFSLLGNVDKVFEELTEAVKEASLPDSDELEAPSTPDTTGTYLGNLAFLITNGNFDSINMVENDEQYLVPNIRGVVCADYGPDKMPGVYYLGAPQFTEGTPPAFKWDVLRLDKLFKTPEITDGYFTVANWYNPDGTVTENVEWWGSQQATEAKHETIQG